MELVSPLFKDIDKKKLSEFLKAEGAFTKKYNKDEYIFFEGDTPKYLYILQSGEVQVERSFANGRQIIVNRFVKKGTVFAEVYVYLNERSFDYSCVTTTGAEVLHLPRTILNSEKGPVAQALAWNMLTILSEKAFFLNQKLIIQSATSLRQKIGIYLLSLEKNRDHFELPLNREEWAAYLGVTRPSLSRELMKMQDEGILEVHGKDIIIQREILEEISF